VRRPIRATALLLLGAVLVWPAAAGFAQTEGELRIEAVDAREFPTVVATVTPPPELYGVVPTPAELSVLEDGVDRPAVAQILTDEPLEVMLVIDTSGSMRGDALASAQDAAIQFIDRMPPTTRFGVMGFGNEPEVVSEFSDDRDAARTAVAGLEATGETALYDAVLTALDQFAVGDDARPFIVLLSDGGDTVSTATLDEATEALDETGVGLYAVSLQTDETDLTPLETLTEVTAGRVVAAEDTAELAEVYDQIADELVNQLTVRFTSASGGIVDLSITISVDGIEASGESPVNYGTTGTTTTTSTTTTTAATSTTVTTPVGDGQDGDGGTAIAISPPPTFTGSGPGPFGSAPALWIGVIAFFVAVLLAVAASAFPREETTGITDFRRRSKQEETYRPSGGGLLAGLTGRAQNAADAVLRRTGRRSGLAVALDSAGIHLSPGEFIILASSGALVGLAIGLVVFGPLGGILIAVAALIVPRLILSRRVEQRRAAFADQLEGTLQLLAGSLRAGYGLVQSVATVASEAASPTSEEFNRIVVETRLGRDLVESMGAIADRMRSQDFRWIVQAVDIQRTVGGDLAEVLDTAAATIRERNQIRRQIKALSAEGRFSAYILIALPFLLGLIIVAIIPDFLDPLFERTAGRLMLAGGAILMVIGIIWIRRIIKLVF
jgi:tight adherence protein B